MAPGETQRVLKVSSWTSSTSEWPDRQVGSARLRTVAYEVGRYRSPGFEAYTHVDVLEQIQVKVLEQQVGEGWSILAVDDPPNRLAMRAAAKRIRGGRVLVAGLGLGMVVQELLRNPRLKRISVVEISRDVTCLVAANLPEKSPVDYWCEDFLAHVNHPGGVGPLGSEQEWDHILVDIWTMRDWAEQFNALQMELLPLLDRLDDLFPDAELHVPLFGNVPRAFLWLKQRSRT